MKLKNYIDECLHDPEFEQEYLRSRPEFEIRKAILLAREEQGIIQKQLAEKTGKALLYGKPSLPKNHRGVVLYNKNMCCIYFGGNQYEKMD